MIEGHQRQPDISVSARDIFGVDLDFAVPAFSRRSEHVPEIDPDYHFDGDVTLAILLGFTYNRRVLVHGYHGTGKSSHIEQVAARLNWPCIRINLDGHITRVDLIGRDTITLRDGLQVTEFREGILPQALQQACALVFDEYDAGRPDVMFVIQRVLESEGKLTLLEQNRVISAHPWFRLFATSNTLGLGDTTNLYYGTQPINQAQMDRWNIVAALDFLSPEQELKVLLRKAPHLRRDGNSLKTASAMVELARLTRFGFVGGDLSTLMSTRTVIAWAENAKLIGSVETAFRLAFLNKCDEAERATVAEYYQRCLAVDIGLPKRPVSVS